MPNQPLSWYEPVLQVLFSIVMANHQQLSDLLSYEEAVALKDLASETQTESHFMCQMAVRTCKDYERQI